MTGYTPHPEPSAEEHEVLAALLAASIERAAVLIVRVPTDGFDEADALREKVRAWREVNPGHLRHLAHGARAFEELEPELEEERGYVSVRMIDPYAEAHFPVPDDPEAIPAMLDAVLDLLPIMAPFAWPNRPELDLIPKAVQA